MDKIGKYQIIGQIGQGAMGVVYKAMDPFIERVVAVKTMSADLDADPEVRARFFREARSAGQLSHKNIVTIYDLGEEGGKAYMAMEFLDGEDLKHSIGRRDKMSLERKLEWMIEILEGLAHAHNKQVIHRDIKPGNIHITRSGQVKILDFGLARVSSSDITKTGSVMGTPNYMSPEQIRSEGVDHRSDIFSAGATFYELLTYRKPFHSSSLPATFFKILQQDPEPIESIDPSIPPDFSAIILRAMAKDPEKRYQSVDDMLRDLDRLRKSLVEQRRTAAGEAKDVIAALDRLIEDNRELLQDEAVKLQTSDLSYLLNPAKASQSEDADATQRIVAPVGYAEIIDLRDRARLEYQRLQDLLEKRKQAAAVLREAEELERKGDFEAALGLTDQVISVVPDHPVALDLRARMRKNLLSLAEREASEAMEQLDRLVIDNPFLKEFVADLENNDQTLPMITLPDPAAGGEDLTDVQQSPWGYVEMLRLRDRARREFQRLAAIAETRRVVTLWLKEAQDLENRGEFDAALGRIDKVLGELPDSPEGLQARARIEAAVQEEKRLQESRQAAGALHDKAAGLFAADELESARELLEQALSRWPDHPGARDLLGRIQERARQKAELARRAGEARSRLADARLALKSDEFGRARAELAGALGLDSNVDGASELAREIERREAELRARRERERRAQELLEQVRSAIGAGQDVQAARHLESLVQVDPQHPEAPALREQVEQLRIEREGAEREKRERIASALAQAREANAAGNFEQAIEVARSVLKEEPKHREAFDLLQVAQRELEARRKREQLERKATEFLARAKEASDRNDLAAAVSSLQQAEPAVAGIASIKEALQRYKAALQAQKDAAKKAEQIRQYLAKGQKAFESGEFQACEQELNRVLALDPNCREAVELRGRAQRLLQEKQAEERRRREIAEALQSAAQALKAGQLDSALRSAGRVSELDPANAEAARLRTEIERRKTEAREQQQKRERAGRFVEEARSLLKRGDTPAASRALSEARGLVPDLPEAGKLGKLIDRQARKSARAVSPGRAMRLPYIAAAAVAAVGLLAFIYYGRGGASLSQEPPPDRAASTTPVSAPPTSQPRVAAQNPPTPIPEPSAPPVKLEAPKTDRPDPVAQQVTEENRRARQLYDSGRHDDAMKAVSEVLRRHPSNPDARRLLVQLEQKRADDALQQLRPARERAEAARASTLAPDAFKAAEQLSAEAMKLYLGREYRDAAARLFEAIAGFRAAEAEAEKARTAELERVRAVRSGAENAQDAYEQARTRAVAAGAEKKAPDSFRQGTNLAAQARTKLEREDYAGARTTFESASSAMKNAVEAAGSDQREWDALKNSRNVASLQAFAKKHRGSPFAEQAMRRSEQLEWESVNKKSAQALRDFLQQHPDGSYSDAVKAELEKLDRENRETRDRQGVLQAIDRYAGAFERKDMGQLQQAWPGIPRGTLKTISDSLKDATSIKMVIVPSREPDVSGDTATVTCRRTISQVFDRTPKETEDRITVKLRRRNGNWIIESIE